VFTVEERDRVRERLLAKAHGDERILAAAEVGSLAVGGGDRWSDLDLTFAVAEDISVADVLEDWTDELAHELEAIDLFDLPVGSTIYRVFMLPGLLQVDLSFTPVSDFHPRGPKFVLLFGEAGAPVHTPPPRAQELLGLAVHHAHRARFSIERGRSWQAQYLIDELRRLTLELACLRLGLPARFGRGLDGLPHELLDAFEATLLRTVERAELARALERNVELLLRESEHVEGAVKLGPILRSLQA
jgi:hypothetical protein